MKTALFLFTISVLILCSTWACKSPQVVSKTPLSTGGYEFASYDTSLYGGYLRGFFLRGCRLNLYKDHTFEYEWFCDIRPLHRNIGTFTRTENTIILNGNALVTWLMKDSQWVMNEVEHVYDTAVQLFTDTFNIIRMGGLTLIDYQPLDSDKTKLFNIVLHDTIPEGMKMQVLPFRKMRWVLD